MSEKMTKLELSQRLNELANEVMKPWHEIHSMVLKADGQHNRIMGLGIKVNSFKVFDAIRTLAKNYEDEWNHDKKGEFVDINRAEPEEQENEE